MPLVFGQAHAAEALAVWSFARSFGPALQLSALLHPRMASQAARRLLFHRVGGTCRQALASAHRARCCRSATHRWAG